jgi:hypothetical protein
LSTSIPRLSPVDVPRLRDEIAGRVIAPDDAEYDAARVVAAGDVDRRPAVIVRVANAADVAHAVGVARDTGLELAVRSGGHSSAGHGVTEGGIVIDLRDMKAIEIDSRRRTAWAETGLTAAEVSTAAAAHGLAIGFGDTGSVGIGGITLGGGVGYLVRKHGLTIDSLLGAEIVTADGRLRIVDAEREPDLFWAIRGGGGNFGVATRFHYQLHPLQGVVGGMLVLPATAEVVAGFMAAAEAAPEQLSTIANVMNCPPMPFIPEQYHGSLVVLAFMCWSGDQKSGDRVMAPFRALATPLADEVKPISYPEMFPPEDESYRPKAVGRTMFLKAVDGTAARTIVDFLNRSDAPMRAAQLRMLGGAMSRVPADATAFAHRSSPVMAIVVSFYEGPDDKPQREAWVREFAASLDQGLGGAYVNFLEDEGEARVREAYPGATWDRLASIKARYDPENLFRLNQNVPPAG